MKNEWTEGGVRDFLELSSADMALIETRVALAKMLRDRRIANGITQLGLAKASEKPADAPAK